MRFESADVGAVLGQHVGAVLFILRISHCKFSFHYQLSLNFLLT